jgi:hypothetical protein
VKNILPVATTHPCLVEIELIPQPNHLGNLMGIILHTVSHMCIRREGDLVLFHHHPVYNGEPPNSQPVGTKHKAATSKFTGETITS